MQLTFASEANSLEFFMISSSYKPTSDDIDPTSNRVKLLMQDLATVTGFAPLPLLHMFGFHFCKWYPVSAEMLMQRN